MDDPSPPRPHHGGNDRGGRTGREWVVRTVRIAGLLLLLLGIARIGILYLLPHAIVMKPQIEGILEFAPADRYAGRVSEGRTVVDVSARGLELAWLEYAAESDRGGGEPAGTVILLHGHGDCKEPQVEIASAISRRGYRVIIPDLPAHGASEGDYVTFGVVEGEAIASLVDSLIPTSGRAGTGPIILWGHSLGGATAIQAAVRNRRVGAVVSLSAFSGLRDVVPDYLRAFLPFFPLLISPDGIDEAVTQAGAIAGFSPESASTSRAAARLGVPLLVIHGEDDMRMPSEHAERIATAARDATLMLIPEADHTDVYHTAGVDSLVGTIVAWIEETDRDGVPSSGQLGELTLPLRTNRSGLIRKLELGRDSQ